MAFTLANAVQFLKDNDHSATSERKGRNYQKIANDSNIELRRAGKFDFDRRIGTVTFAAPYSTGTVDVGLELTTVTGHSTVFTAAMVGGYIQFNDESLAYEITAFTSGTSITIGEGYHGSAALTGVEYEITFPRQSLPTRFRDFEKPVLSSGKYRLEPLTLLDMTLIRQASPSSSNSPNYYATEETEVSSIPTKKIWVYPSPSEKMTLTLVYFQWPPECTADADLFRIPYEAESALREFMLALLKREQGSGDWMNAYNIAKAVAQETLGTTRLVSESGQREEYWPNGDEEGGFTQWPRLANPS